MSKLPKILRNYTAYVDGVGYAGVVTECKPPNLTIKTEDFEAGGLAGPVPIDMGQIDKMESEITLAEHNPEVMALLGKDGVLWTLRGAQGEGTGNAEAVIYSMRGMVQAIEPEALGKGMKTVKVKLLPRMVKVTIAGREVIHVDTVANIRAIGGVDQMAAIRTALGQ